MSLYIDSAILDEVREAISFGWVKGVTTNPILLSKAGKEPHQVLKDLASMDVSAVFYQLMSRSLSDMRQEALAAKEIVGEKLVLKLCPTMQGYQFVAENAENYPCCVTAVYSAAQAMVANQAGARWVAVYVNRYTRMGGDGPGLVAEIASVLKDSQTGILAASIKDPQEAAAAWRAGASDLTLPLSVLRAMMENDISSKTGQDFLENGVGLTFR
jgi:transaldolase